MIVRRLFQRRGGRDRGPEPETEETRPCPHCGEQISRGATVCLHCERDLTPVMTPVAFQNFLRTRGMQTPEPVEERPHADQP